MRLKGCKEKRAKVELKINKRTTVRAKMITQEEVQKILQKKGDARGVVFQTDANYILKEKKGIDIKQAEKKLKQWGVDLKYKDVKAMAWYPVAWRTLSLLASKEVFGWQDDDIKKMGENAPKVSIIVKLFFKLFPDIEKFAKQVPNYWRKHYTVGELEVVKLDKENKAMLLHLTNFAFHPLQCKYYEGYFAETVQLIRPKGSVVVCQEIQCSFRDNVPYEAYQIKWSK